MCAICGCLSVIYVERQRKIGHKDKHGISTVINSASAHQKFHQLQQKEGETVLQFVTGLRKDGKDCNFDADFDNQIRDLVWCKCKSDFVKHKLFEERQQLTLTWMLELSEQCERAEHQISYLSVSKQGTEDPNRIYENPGRPNGQQKSKGNKQDKHCNSCGSSGHLGGDPKCPARGQACRKCIGKDHVTIVSAKPNHKNLGLINHKKNHMQIGIKLIY